MRHMKFSKVRITDNRPSRPTGLDYLAASQARECAEHNRAIRDFDENTLLAIAGDLGRRICSDRKNPEHRWTMARKAAVLRRLDHLKAFTP